MQQQKKHKMAWNGAAGYSNGTCNGRSYTRWNGMLLQANEVAHQQQDPTGDVVECSCRLLLR
jgi:hypothetical protein